MASTPEFPAADRNPSTCGRPGSGRAASVALGAFALLLGGCQVERLFPGRVAQGVARLTVRHAATLVTAIEQDDRCGFASAAALDGASFTGAPGEPGSSTRMIEGCRLDFGGGTVASTDCDGVPTTLSGAVTLSGTMTTRGTRTGSRAVPMVPDAADAVSFDLVASFEDFAVRIHGQDASMVARSGTLAIQATPHLAASASTGLCSVPTGSLALTGLAWSGATVEVDTGSRVFTAAVPSSELAAQTGAWGQDANSIGGRITVWGSERALPSGGSGATLDPDYEPDAFAARFNCAPDLALPSTHACASLQDVEAQGVAALTVATFAAVATRIDEDGVCGFASASALASAEVSGEIGRAGGTATYELGEPCRLDFEEVTLLSEDCTGLRRFARGTVWASGTKTVRGIVTGDPAAWIVPTAREAGSLQLALRFDDFEVSDSAGNPTLRIGSGSLSGGASQLMALDRATGACSIKTAHASLSGLVWSALSGVLVTDGVELPVAVASSAIDAVNGTVGARSNFLAGTVRFANGDEASIPTRGGAAVLDPAYDAATFDAGFACLPRIEIPADDGACSFQRPLAEAAARLIIQNIGAVARAVNDDARCGFETLRVKVGPTDVQGKPGQQGSMTWGIEGCEIGRLTAPHKLGTDCDGTTTWTSGTLSANATRVVAGRRIKAPGTPFDSIVPGTPDAVGIHLVGVSLDQFQAYTLTQGATRPAAALLVHSGWLAGEVVPILGERKSAAGTFDRPTPVARFARVDLSHADATLIRGAMRFRLAIDSAKLHATAGTWEGHGNRISGTITLDGHPIILDGLALDPSFRQPRLDQSYACTTDLARLVR